MKRILPILLSLLCLTLSLLPSIGAGAQPQPFSADPAGANLIEAVNALRESNGLDPYQEDPILTGIAQRHADYVASTGVSTHIDADGKHPYQRALDAGYQVAGNLSTGGYFAEAIYSGRAVPFEDVAAAWQSNSSDANAILFPDYQDVGVGIAAADGVTYYVLNAGSETVPTTGTPSKVAVTSTMGTGTALIGIINTPQANGEIFHIVQKDEALWSIALAYNTTIEELKRLNGLASDEIFEGQRLLIRRASTETPTATVAPVTATLGIPTSTATQPAPPTATNTPTPVPAAPVSLRSSGAAVVVIVLIALLAAGLGAFLGRKKEKASD